MEGFKKKIQHLAANYREEVISIRRHMHQHPELSNEEYETADFLASKLKAYGISYRTGVFKTGITALIKGRKPDRKVVALRADMDALPIQEQNEVEYKSMNKGRMHACGHDVHTASLLGTARILQELKDDFEGSVKLIFQPAEEKIPGGAKFMIEEGVLKNPEVKSIIGQHVFPEIEVGKAGFKTGMYMASTDEINLTIKGRGGHAAMPDLLVDPVLVASQIVVALQQIVSRHANYNIPTVLSFGQFLADGTYNVIPDEVRIKGTFRTFDEEWRARAHDHIARISQSIAKASGAVCEVFINKGYPFLVNDDIITENAVRSAEQYLGKENVIELKPRMTAEDFAYFSQDIPGCFYRLGTGNKEKGITSNLHTPTFDVDEKSLEIGMGLMAWITFNELRY
ncbi:MAG: amidohydrolase [Bacteroidales bacterium]|nr:amidohydrolase [Bacteroidales bacterium]MCF8376250.1 amidohydrolase [Bacteroidales bacterium]MCF8401193.1 amidohydrolase [Bacteroidales bacterium]